MPPVAKSVRHGNACAPSKPHIQILGVEMMNKENEEVIVVIQCAGKKRPCAETFLSPDGRPVRFVAHPEAGHKESEFYAHPDDDSGDGQTWRQKLQHYNEQKKESNPYDLISAGELYRPKTTTIYLDFFKELKADKYFLLSPGWGLVRSDFLLPNYDITFSGSVSPVNDWANKKAIRRKWPHDCFEDGSMLPEKTNDTVLFFGGEAYRNLFLKLTENMKAERVVFYCTEDEPECPGCTTVRFGKGCYTNWQYGCAKKFLAGTLEW